VAWVGPRESAGARRPVVVGVDGSQGSARALGWALREALDRQAPLRIVTAWSWDTTSTGSGSASAGLARQARQTQEALVRAVLATFPGTLPDLTAELVQADPASALIDQSVGGDLLVLGSRGMGGAAGAVIGSVADACLRHGSCPVVVVPSEPAVEVGLPGLKRTAGRRTGLAPAALAAFGLL
jgi:nucleotide-binding universal stress UspA family protein